jgi:MFS family permease
VSVADQVVAPWPERTVAWTAVAIFCAAAILSCTDRQILNLLVDPIGADLRIDDTRFSLLQGIAFALIYALAGLPPGRLADILPRRTVIARGVVLRSLATRPALLPPRSGCCSQRGCWWASARRHWRQQRSAIDFSMLNWTPALLSRRLGYSPGEIAVSPGTVSIAAGLIGSQAGGVLSDRFAARGGPRGRIVLALFAVLIGLAGAGLAVAQSGHQAIVLFALWFCLSAVAARPASPPSRNWFPMR